MLFEFPLVQNFVSRKVPPSGDRKKVVLEDGIDRLHSVLSVVILGTFSLLLCSTQLLRRPITCYLSAELERARGWSNYIHDYCLIHGTHRYLEGSFEQLPAAKNNFSIFSDARPNSYRMTYYQWVPFFLLFQMCCFFLPMAIWKYLQSFLDVDMANIVETCMDISACTSNEGQRASKIEQVASYIFSYFYYHRSKRGFFARITNCNATATTLYFVVKILCLANCIAQIFLICHFLGFHSLWSVDVLSDLIDGIDSKSQFTYFPLEVGCRYTIYEERNFHAYLTRCLLPMNYWNEKVFLVLWMWFVLLVALSVIRCIGFLVFRGIGSTRKLMISYLDDHCYSLDGRLAKRSKISYFASQFLGADGVLLSDFITQQAGSKTSSDVFIAVWERFSAEKGLSRSLQYDTWSMDSNQYMSLPYPEAKAAGDGFSVN